MRKKVMCVFGTRPEAVKLAPVVHALGESSELQPVVAITAQHREMLDQMMKWFDVKADYDLDLMQHGQTLAQLTARVVLGMDELLTKDRPDLLLVQGDTVTVMAASLAAFYHKVPVGHVEAGLRTNDRYNPFPEEMSRRQTGRIATLHFAPTALAVENLKAEGITENVFMTGNTVIDALLDTAARLKESDIDQALFGRTDFNKYKVLLVTAHRRENWGQGMDEIALALKAIADEFPDVQILYPIHRNPVVRKSIEPVFEGHERLVLVEPLDYVPFVSAMRRCHFILTDSGGVQEEAPALGKPVLVMRTNTERPEAVQAGAARLVGVVRDTIAQGARELLTSPQLYQSMSASINPFGDGSAARRIVKEVENFLRSH
ncbi:MAG: UDP-N-acetylglucosamine 2-epimerase (non-hydrolyzing) [Candidatus Obscuribacterales bacterium]|nr:UDP-N-acetylglucosamine 2-epimerase (non-hydrolyzing) [Candidatus Obscuribacterales bacterium]